MKKEAFEEPTFQAVVFSKDDTFVCASGENAITMSSFSSGDEGR